MKKIFSICFVLFFPAFAFAQHGTDPIKITDMLKIKSINDVAVSKDGSKTVCTLTTIETDGDNKLDYKYETQLWIVNTDGNSSPKQLTTKENSSQAVFSPNGKQIVFVRTSDGKPQLFLLSLDGGEAIQLTK